MSYGLLTAINRIPSTCLATEFPNANAKDTVMAENEAKIGHGSKPIKLTEKIRRGREKMYELHAL